ncbi:hypothetical protein C8R44DRAFT_750499 [Mycena epipterygia]|nr:hypothetical protein C8R44DRAFT_750499 [Mycena epipterygia]
MHLTLSNRELFTDTQPSEEADEPDWRRVYKRTEDCWHLPRTISAEFRRNLGNRVDLARFVGFFKALRVLKETWGEKRDFSTKSTEPVREIWQNLRHIPRFSAWFSDSSQARRPELVLHYSAEIWEENLSERKYRVGTRVQWILEHFLIPSANNTLKQTDLRQRIGGLNRPKSKSNDPQERRSEGISVITAGAVGAWRYQLHLMKVYEPDGSMLVNDRVANHVVMMNPKFMELTNGASQLTAPTAQMPSGANWSTKLEDLLLGAAAQRRTTRPVADELIELGLESRASLCQTL